MSSIGNAIRILSCDDHALFRQGIAALLATQPDMSLVAEAATEEQVMAIRDSVFGLIQERLNS